MRDNKMSANYIYQINNIHCMIDCRIVERKLFPTDCVSLDNLIDDLGYIRTLSCRLNKEKHNRILTEFAIKNTVNVSYYVNDFKITEEMYVNSYDKFKLIKFDYENIDIKLISTLGEVSI